MAYSSNRSSLMPSLLPPWILRWIVLLWTPGLVSSLLQQQFRRTPDNQTATVGDTVTLACNVINKSGILQWTRDGFGLGTERNLVGYERYRMVGNEEEGDFTLVIDHVTLEDDAVFQCQVGPGPDGIRELRSPNTKLTVEVPTGAPQILQGDLLQTTEDREIRLECISRGGKPAAEITWIDGSGQEIKSGVEIVKEDLEDRKRQNTRSILKLTPKRENHNKTFTCQAHNRPAKEVMSSFIRLEVKYAPKITLRVTPSVIREGDNIRISCRAEGNPPEMVHRWFLNDQVIGGDHGTVLSIQNVTRLRHDAIVKCEVQNSVGKSQESQTLQVNYGPVFRNPPRNVQAALGTSVTLTCDVLGNPSPEIVWFHEQTRVAVSTFPNYTVTVTPDTAGRYICQAVVQGFPEVSAEAVILLKGPPKILSQRIQFGSQGETVRLECLAVAIPRPDRVTWSHLGREIDFRDSDYSILEDPLPDGVRSTLVIPTSQETDFGPYNCSVTNPYGTHVMEIYLMKHKSGQLVVILTCVIAGVVVIVAITMISLLCQRKAKKPTFLSSVDADGVEKQTNKSDRSSNDSDLKVEIRTTSSLSNMQEHDSEHWDDGASDAHLKNESLYRYSDYLDPVFPPKPDGHNNNGYIQYADYSRDYTPGVVGRSGNIYGGGPPGPLLSSSVGLSNSSHQQQLSPPQYLNNGDPRYSAAATNYGNPYLRSTSNSSLPPPLSHHVVTNSPSGQQLNLANSHVPAGSHHHLHHHNISNHIPMTTTTPSASSHYLNSHNNGSSSHILNNGSQQHILNNGYGLRNGAVPQVPNISRAPSTPSPQYIVPNQAQLKPGTLATHV